MSQKLIKQLKQLKNIEPDPNFAVRSKLLILSSPRKMGIFWVSPVWRFGFALGIFAIITTLTILFQTNKTPQPVLSSSFSENKLQEEFDNLSINISLEEIKYRQALNQAIVSALNEVSENLAK